jgi:hypothetical protein
METRYYPKPHRVTLDQQIYRMSCQHPGFKIKAYLRQRAVTWVGRIRPTPMSDEYTIAIELTVGYRPKVRILEPVLRIRDGASCLPHYYTESGTLCLHEAHEWSSLLNVADCIVPWASLWLYFYEVWFITGSWEGGGTHPDKPEHKAT